MSARSAAITKIELLLKAMRKAKVRLESTILFLERQKVLEEKRHEAAREAARVKKKRRRPEPKPDVEAMEAEA